MSDSEVYKLKMGLGQNFLQKLVKGMSLNSFLSVNTVSFGFGFVGG
jgi:hypothetical protein